LLVYSNLHQILETIVPNYHPRNGVHTLSQRNPPIPKASPIDRYHLIGQFGPALGKQDPTSTTVLSCRTTELHSSKEPVVRLDGEVCPYTARKEDKQNCLRWFTAGFDSGKTDGCTYLNCNSTNFRKSGYFNMPQNTNLLTPIL
jgi:hypothetical protein